MHGTLHYKMTGFGIGNTGIGISSDSEDTALKIDPEWWPTGIRIGSESG